MKVSAWVAISDLIPVKKTKVESLIDAVFGEKTMFQTHPIPYVFTSLKEAGVDGVELLIPLRSTDENISEVKEILTKCHMPVFSIHQSLTSLVSISLDEIERLCNIANLFSAKIVVLHSGALDKKLFDNKVLNTLKALQKKHNILFGIENMQITPYALGKSFTYNASKFATVVRNADLHITLDTTHLAQARGNIISFYEDNKERIVNIHLSDYKKNLLNHRLLLHSQLHLPLLKGELPIQKFVKVLKQTNYSGLITMEIDGDLEELCNSARVIKNK